MYSRGCAGWMVDPVKAELGPQRWRADVQDWVRRAHRGTGVKGAYGSRTAYWFGRSNWGGPIIGPCAPKPTPTQGKGNGNGNGNGHDPKPTDPPPPPEPTPKP